MQMFSKNSVFIFIAILLSLALIVSSGTIKDSKKNKYPNKSKNTETSIEKEEDSKKPTDSLVVGNQEKEKETSSSDTSLSTNVKPTYLWRVRSILRRVLEIIGWRDARKSRMLGSTNENDLDDEDEQEYKEEVRATVGAVLGRKDCLDKIACKAGSMMRAIKGKEIVLVILEKVSPTSWLSTFDIMKKSAVEEDEEECKYSCLDDEL